MVALGAFYCKAAKVLRHLSGQGTFDIQQPCSLDGFRKKALHFQRQCSSKAKCNGWKQGVAEQFSNRSALLRHKNAPKWLQYGSASTASKCLITNSRCPGTWISSRLVALHIDDLDPFKTPKCKLIEPCPSRRSISQQCKPQDKPYRPKRKRTTL